MSRVLDVWLLGQHVGQLALIDGRLRFSYSPVGGTFSVSNTDPAETLHVCISASEDGRP
ncbi:MAG: hypothetical protein KIT55_09745 [Nitrosomonas sp.]|nr:hypothetical protein [Nitrosomonas sp.]